MSEDFHMLMQSLAKSLIMLGVCILVTMCAARSCEKPGPPADVELTVGVEDER